MNHPAPFAIAPGGAMICGDGPELLVYGDDGRPLWKAFVDGALVAVAGDGDAVVAADSDGRVGWYGAVDGRLLDEARIDGASAWAIADGQVAAATGAGLVVLARGGAPRALPHPAPAALAFGPGAASVAVAVGEALRVVDPVSGGAWGEVALGAEITGVAWSPAGSWLVTAGTALFAVSGDGATVLGRVDADGPLSRPAASADGVLAAAVLGPHRVVVFDVPGGRSVGHVDFRRHVGGIAFGPPGRLGVGLDDGDATCVDCYVGGATRTEPHPGRGRNNWNLDVRLDLAAVRGALARQKAGGADIATYTGWRPEEGGGWWRGCLLAGGGCAVALFGCLGCAGLAWLLRAFGLI